MADELAIMMELGDSTHLVLYTDTWLENERVCLQQQLSEVAERLDGILAAQRVKGRLQQRNLVAVRCVEKSDGMPSDVILKVCPVGDAAIRLETELSDNTIPEDISDMNYRQQIDTWTADGYDVPTSKNIGRQIRYDYSRRLS